VSDFAVSNFAGKVCCPRAEVERNMPIDTTSSKAFCLIEIHPPETWSARSYLRPSSSSIELSRDVGAAPLDQRSTSETPGDSLAALKPYSGRDSFHAFKGEGHVSSTSFRNVSLRALTRTRFVQHFGFGSTKSSFCEQHPSRTDGFGQ